MANKVAYEGLQIHGGPGYMHEFNAERHFRDVRITNIYEGTTQLQIVAAIGPITSGAAAGFLDEMDGRDYGQEANKTVSSLLGTIRESRKLFDEAVSYAKSYKGNDGDDPKVAENFLTYHARRLVEMATGLVISYILLRDATYSERKLKVAEIWIAKMPSRLRAAYDFITNENGALLRCYKAII
jgi:alkylation response protein AidB-like acyl-CoA dehydrogenase